MKINFKITFAAIFLFTLSIVSYGQDEWTDNQKNLINAMNDLSKTTAPNGKGADAYGRLLSEDFSRWTIGSTVLSNKEKWVNGVREWFDEGWRVSERKQKNLEILAMDSFAFTRRIVTETYKGPDGETSTSEAALVEIWKFKEGHWLLFRVNVHPMKND